MEDVPYSYEDTSNYDLTRGRAQIQKILTSSDNDDNQFGWSISIDGDYAIIG